VRFTDRAGGVRPGRKVLTLVHAMVAGASHIRHLTGCARGRRPGARAPGHGALDARDFAPSVQFRPRPPIRRRHIREPAPGLGAGPGPGGRPAGGRRGLHHLRATRGRTFASGLAGRRAGSCHDVGGVAPGQCSRPVPTRTCVAVTAGCGAQGRSSRVPAPSGGHKQGEDRTGERK
jgi:hypothetical protein